MARRTVLARMGIDGSKVLGTVGITHNKQCDGSIVHPVATTNNIQANQYCDGSGYCDESVKDTLRHDPTEMRESTRSDKTYINLVIPLIKPEAFSKSWKEIKETLFGGTSTDEFHEEVQRLLEECRAAKESDESDSAEADLGGEATESTENGAENLFAEGWEEEVYYTHDEEGTEYVIYSAKGVDEYGETIEQSGIIEAEAFDGNKELLLPNNGKVNMESL